MSAENVVRTGSAPNFCPPVTEGETFEFQDEKGDVTSLEFLGTVIADGRHFAFFFPVDEDSPALSSGDVLALEATEFEDEEPVSFELVDDEQLLVQAYAAFKEATKDLYRFE